MKKRYPKHPKLYIDFKNVGGYYYCYYYSNNFNDNNNRIIQEEIKDIFPESKKIFLFNENKKQFNILKKYLMIQKSVLEKRKKAGNYEACNIIKDSIKTIANFEADFNVWFEQNKIN